MSKVLSICVVLICVLGIMSCEKERPAAEACFDTGSADLKSGKIIRFMNCSKYYDATRWYIINGGDNTDTLFNGGLFMFDTLKHLPFTFGTPGNYNVSLRVWQRDNGSESTFTQNITVSAP